MTIRVRLTALVTLLTAAVCVVSLWFGLGALRAVAVDGALDPQVEELETWIEFADAGTDVDLDTEELMLIGDEIELVFQPEIGWEPVVSPQNRAALIEEFGADGLVYVSAVGFSESGDWVWPVDDAGAVGSAVDIERLPDDTAVVTLLALYELIDYSAFDELAELVELDEADVFESEEGFELAQDVREGLDEADVEAVAVDGSAEESRATLAFSRVEVDGRDYGLAIDVTDELSAIDSVSPFLWASVGVIVLLAATATWFTSGRALAPVQAMTETAQVLSSTDLSERLPGAERSDEIGNLTVTLNGMLARLEQSDLRRRRFVSDASHELRTPLAVLRNQAEVARSAPETTSIGALAAVVENESARMTSMVEDLLVLARHDEVAAASRSARAVDDEVFDLDDVVLEEVHPTSTAAGRRVGGFGGDGYEATPRRRLGRSAICSTTPPATVVPSLRSRLQPVATGFC